MTNARSLTAALRGRWHGRFGTAPCPICQPEGRRDQNALTLADASDRLLLNCKKSRCRFEDLLTATGLMFGSYAPPDPVILAQREAEGRAEAAKRERQARAIWDQAAPLSGTVAETYLRGRGIKCAPPNTLRCHPDCWHGPTAKRHPALVARVDGGDGFAIHRTFLRPDGSGKADTKPAKMMLGTTAGGAVRLTEGAGPLLVAEGIETAASAFILRGDGHLRTWAALSASGMAALRLPAPVGNLIVAPDGDKAGHAAGLALADRASREGWRVTILTPPHRGDFNDLLRGAAA